MTAFKSSRVGIMDTRPAFTKSENQTYVATDATGLFGSTSGGGHTHETYLSDGTRWLLVMQYGPTVVPVDVPTGAAWPDPHPAFAVLVDEGFEAVAGDNPHNVFSTIGSGVSISTANPHAGTKHLRDSPVGLSSASVQNISANNRQIVARFWFYLHSLPTPVNQYLLQFNGPSRFATFVSTTGHLKAQIGSLNLPDIGTVSINAWHSCDLSIDASDLAISTMKVRMDGGTEQTLAAPVASNDIVRWQVDSNASTLQTMMIDYDQIKISNDPSTYPLTDT